jgi:hypothetical protein
VIRKPKAIATGVTAATRDDRLMARGIFAFVLAVYVLTSPGRIDTLDSQVRYAVAQSMLHYGRPYLLDPALQGFGVWGWDGSIYSSYGAAASVLGLPFILIGNLWGDAAGELSRLLYSLVPCIFGALIAVVLFKFYRELGVGRRAALGWTMVSSFATLLWPLAASSFENVERAFFVLGAVYCAWVAAQRRSDSYALAGGFLAGFLVLYRSYMMAMIPCLGLPILAAASLAGREGAKAQSRHAWLSEPIRDFLARTPEARQARHLAKYFLEASTLGIAGSMAFSLLRFGSLFYTTEATATAGPSRLWQNPLVGLASLAVSPGKGILLYSPAIILGFVGFKRLWRRSPQLGLTLLAVMVLTLIMVCPLTFFGGDWCWGPRYLENVVVLWALAFPFLPACKGRRWYVAWIVGLSFAVQLLGLAVDYQGFFFKRNLQPYFWLDDRWFYFQHSALWARPGEILALRDGPPPEARQFAPCANPAFHTYCIFGPPARLIPQSSRWMRHFQVLYLPRPWPLWMLKIPADQRPIPVAPWIAANVFLALLGAGAMGWSLSSAHDQERA